MNINRQEIIKLAGFTGAAMLIAGYLRHTILEIWGGFNLSLVIVGGILLVASIGLNFGSIITFFGGRSAKLGTNTLILSAAVLAILAILNFLGFRHHKRFDLTTEKIYTLSDQSKKILGNLQKDVKVIKLDKADDQKLGDLMSEFKYSTKRISYERIDPQQKPEVAAQYKVQRMGETLVTSGDKIERPQRDDEQGLINAVLKVTRDKPKQICFSEGHDEKVLTSSEGTGFAVVDKILKNENYDVKTITLATAPQVPAECDVLVTAGPKKPFVAQETAAIAKYLDEGGKYFLLIDPNTEPELNDVLKAWNIVVGNDTVIAGPGAGVNASIPVAVEYGDHPITKDMRRVQTFYIDARSVKPGEAAKGQLNQTELIKTLENTWAETELKGKEPQFDQGKDTKGPISLAVASSKKVGEKEARMVVIGDSDFATNGGMRFGGNSDVFFNTVNWLAQDEDLIAIRPKSTTNRSVTMTESEQYYFFILAVALMPMAVIGSGAYIWWKRR